jgi:shikimate kinase
MMDEAPLTKRETDILRSAGYRQTGGGLIDGRVKIKFIKDGETIYGTRAEWRELVKRLQDEPAQRELRLRLRDESVELLRRASSLIYYSGVTNEIMEKQYPLYHEVSELSGAAGDTRRVAALRLIVARMRELCDEMERNK